jgi:myosin heavy subunit
MHFFTQVLAKLKADLSSVIESASSSSSSSLASDASQDLVKRLQALEGESRQTRKDAAALLKSQSILREDVQRVFGDIDGLKKAEQTALQDREMLQRELNQLRQVGLADVEGGLRDANAKLAEMADFKLKAAARLDAAGAHEHDKFELLAKELQRIKSQIYYLQQSVLQMKAHGGGSAESGVLATAAGNVSVYNGDLATLRKAVASLRDQCVLQDAFQQERERVDQEMALVRSKMDSEMDKVEFRAEKLQQAQTGLTEAEARLNALDGSLEDLVAESRKYNLLLTGLPQEHLLERPAHVTALVSAYLANVLGMPDAVFDEAERVKAPSGAIRVKFPNLREKARVLERSRTAHARSDVAVSEDYSDRVALRRHRLAAFARARAKVLRKKWALRHDELYFNGKVFVYDEKADKVVVKKTFQSVE